MAYAIKRVAGLYLLNKARERRRLAPLCRVWIHQTIQRRSEFDEFHHLLQELRAEEDRFQRYFRLSPAQFDNLLTCIGARISYQDTIYRRSISAEERLSICIRASVQISQLKRRMLWMRVTCVRGLKRSKRVKMRCAGLVKRAAGPLSAPRGAST
ncbi:hypothetical protein CRENBAI_001211 [Crenichthys baileyi]|uniref:Uncharacterized protein n=1 Tax=Crenichthys baileyi TaxID=28760 RepID=A0AAV9R2H3_9TELE